MSAAVRDDSDERPGETPASGAAAAPPPGGACFMTGATGFIGGEALKRVLEREPHRRVYCLVRAEDDARAYRRGRETLFKLFTDDAEATRDAKARVRWLPGDLTRPHLGLSEKARDELTADCSEFLHCAASTEFDLPLDEAHAVNFVGAQAIGELAIRAAKRPGGGFRRLVHVSTAYVAGARSGPIHPEELLPDDGPFNNTYERTKARAERWLRERMGEAPITVVRPSIVVGDSATGRTYNFNVLYFPIKLIHRGLLPYVPGRSQTTLDIVPVDHVCDAAIALGRMDAAAGKTYHLAAGDDAILLSRFGEKMVTYYNARHTAEGRKPVPRVRVLHPLFWAVLRWWLSRRLQGRAKEQFDAFNIYQPYITTEKRFDVSATRKALEGKVVYPRIEDYLDRIAEYAVTREWGRRVSWDPSALVESTQGTLAP